MNVPSSFVSGQLSFNTSASSIEKPPRRVVVCRRGYDQNYGAIGFRSFQVDARRGCRSESVATLEKKTTAQHPENSGTVVGTAR